MDLSNDKEYRLSLLRRALEEGDFYPDGRCVICFAFVGLDTGDHNGKCPVGQVALRTCTEPRVIRNVRKWGSPLAYMAHLSSRRDDGPER